MQPGRGTFAGAGLSCTFAPGRSRGAGMLIGLLVPLALAALVYAALLIRSALAKRSLPNLEAIGLGAITNFFDTLGIGSFAPTMAWFKFRRLVPDRLIPCTMLVGHTPPSMTQGII